MINLAKSIPLNYLWSLIQICIQVKCKRSDHCYNKCVCVYLFEEAYYIERKMLVTFNFSQWIHHLLYGFSLLPFLLWHVENDINTNFSLVTGVVNLFSFWFRRRFKVTCGIPWTFVLFPLILQWYFLQRSNFCWRNEAII